MSRLGRVQLFFFRSLIQFGWVSTGSPLIGDPTFTDMDPVSGAMGTVVTLTGSGFDSPPYTVTVDGHAAASVSTFADSIDFTIAVGTTSGKVVVSDGSNDFEVGLSFEVKRTIDVTLNLPSGVSVLNYELASGTNFVDPVSGSGPHSITVPLDFSGIVWAFRSEEDPVYMAVVTSNDNAVTIDATSTAEGLAFISPLLGTRNDTKTSEIMGLMDGLSELNDLAADPGHADVLAAYEALLRARLDPETVDRQAKADQAALIERHGGREKAKLVGAPGATPVPGYEGA